MSGLGKNWPGTTVYGQFSTKAAVQGEDWEGDHFRRDGLNVMNHVPQHTRLDGDSTTRHPKDSLKNYRNTKRTLKTYFCP
jgi:hypothetical protein